MNRILLRIGNDYNQKVPVNRFIDQYFIEGKERAPIIENLTEQVTDDECSMVGNYRLYITAY